MSQYTCIGLGYVYTLILEYVYIRYRDVHVLYGGRIGVAVYMYRFRLCMYTNNKSTCIYVIEMYMFYTVDTGCRSIHV